MQNLFDTNRQRNRLVRAIGCLAYPAGLGIVVALALFIKSLV